MYFLFFFFFNDTATTEIYTLSLHDALPIWDAVHPEFGFQYLGGIVIGHEQKFVCAQTAGDGQPAHGMAMPCPVDEIGRAHV